MPIDLMRVTAWLGNRRGLVRLEALRPRSSRTGLVSDLLVGTDTLWLETENVV